MDDVTIHIDTLTVDLSPPDAEATATGNLDPLTTAIVSALRAHPALAPFLTGQPEIHTSRRDDHQPPPAFPLR
jgi:hypothetical protein